MSEPPESRVAREGGARAGVEDRIAFLLEARERDAERYLLGRLRAKLPM